MGDNQKNASANTPNEEVSDYLLSQLYIYHIDKKRLFGHHAHTGRHENKYFINLKNI